MFVIVDGNYIDISQRFAGILCNDYDEVHEVMKTQGISHYLFTMVPVQEEKRNRLMMNIRRKKSLVLGSSLWIGLSPG